MCVCVWRERESERDTYIHTNIRTYIHTYIYTYINTYINIYIHTSIHTYIHTYALDSRKRTVIELLVYINMRQIVFKRMENICCCCYHLLYLFIYLLLLTYRGLYHVDSVISHLPDTLEYIHVVSRSGLFYQIVQSNERPCSSNTSADWTKIKRHAWSRNVMLGPETW